MKKYLSISWRLLKNNNIQNYFNDAIIGLYIPVLNEKSDAYIGWGQKKTGLKAQSLGRKYDKPVYLLEDGFLRSLGPSYISKSPLSFIVDDIGIYYDSSKPSHLENLLLNDDNFNSDIVARAKKGIKFLKENNISKYNHAAECKAEDLGIEVDGKPVLLLIDQTYGDASVIGAGAGIENFKLMINDALNKVKTHQILVKIHPEVIAGKKKGYLYDLIQNSPKKTFFNIISNDFNPISLLKKVDEVFTVSSQMGFEAVLVGKETTCYGMSFYAGWGITTDKLKSPRRNKKRTVEEVFAAAYLIYCQYINPFTQKKSIFEDTVRILKLFKDINDRNRKPIICLHMKPWKRKAVSSFLRYNGVSPIYISNEIQAINLAKEKNGRIFAWVSHISDEFEKKCRDSEVDLIRVEDGFIRSRGLGANFNLPYSLSFDDIGIYYNSQKSSRMEKLLQEYKFDVSIINRSKKLIKLVTNANISKYNLDIEENEEFSALESKGRRIILVPGQVDDDKSIKFGTNKLKDSFSILKEVRKRNKDAYIIFKPHPDVLSGQRKKYDNIDEFKNYADSVVSRTNILKLIDISDEVHVLTSLTGFEALIRNKKVYCYGMPFYAGWGLTNDDYSCARRKRNLKLEELVAVALILYPSYIHPQTMLNCSPETFINDLQESQVNYGIISKLRIYWGRIKKVIN